MITVNVHHALHTRLCGRRDNANERNRKLRESRKMVTVCRIHGLCSRFRGGKSRWRYFLEVFILLSMLALNRKKSLRPIVIRRSFFFSFDSIAAECYVTMIFRISSFLGQINQNKKRQIALNSLFRSFHDLPLIETCFFVCFQNFFFWQSRKDASLQNAKPLNCIADWERSWTHTHTHRCCCYWALTDQCRIQRSKNRKLKIENDARQRDSGDFQSASCARAIGRCYRWFAEWIICWRRIHKYFAFEQSPNIDIEHAGPIGCWKCAGYAESGDRQCEHGFDYGPERIHSRDNDSYDNGSHNDNNNHHFDGCSTEWSEISEMQRIVLLRRCTKGNLLLEPGQGHNPN